MTKRNPQINIRVPLELKERLHELASKHQRSVNSEIVERLKQSILPKKINLDVLTADQAKTMANKALKDNKTVLFKRCIKEITANAELGITDFFIEIPEYDGIHWYEDNPIFIEVIEPAYKQLQELGYTVEIEDCCFHVKF